MNKITLFLFLTLLSTTSLFAQNLYVESLTLDENNLRAQINPKLDFNDKKCCVILISTPNMDDAQRHKLEFEGDAGAEVVSVDFPTGEIEIYFSSHAATLTIRHPDLGKLDYDIPIDLKEMKTYKMVLMSAKATTIVEESLTANYLVINVEPKDARIFIDDNFVENKDGVASAMLRVGVTHNVRIEKSLYHTLDTMVMTNANSKVVINKKLRPAFGYIEVNSLPESGAAVIINDKEVGTTPYRSGQLLSGEYDVEIVKSMYRQCSKKVNIIDGNTTEANFEMQPNFAEITLVTDSESTIYLDEKAIGKGRWTGRILAGSHSVMAKKDSHRDTKLTITVEVSKSETIKMDSPIPIYGRINITSDPIDATIYLDNKVVGTTPQIITQVLIGSHTLKLDKKGCAPLTKNIVLEEGKTLNVNEELEIGKCLNISTDKYGDDIFVDDEFVGKSPASVSIMFGKHKIKIKRGEIVEEKNIDITTDSNSEININLGGRLTVKTDKTGDNVYLDSQYMGSSPQTFNVSAGNHTVKATRYGNYKPKEKNVTIKNGEEKEILLKLERKKSPSKQFKNNIGLNVGAGVYMNLMSDGLTFDFNIYAEMLMYKNFGFEVGVQFKKRTYKTSEISNVTYSSVSSNYSFTSIPLLLHLRETIKVGYEDAIIGFYGGPMIDFSSDYVKDTSVSGVLGIVFGEDCKKWDYLVDVKLEFGELGMVFSFGLKFGIKCM